MYTSFFRYNFLDSKENNGDLLDKRVGTEEANRRRQGSQGKIELVKFMSNESVVFCVREARRWSAGLYTSIKYYSHPQKRQGRVEDTYLTDQLHSNSCREPTLTHVLGDGSL